jgi:uncharacterized protein (DUF305 family)
MAGNPNVRRCVLETFGVIMHVALGVRLSPIIEVEGGQVMHNHGRLKVFARSWPILAVFLISCAGRDARSTPPVPPTPAYERDFLENRIAHQRAAIEMAQACVQKAQRDPLKQFCSTLIDTEARESKQLQSWLNQWYAVSAAPGARERTTEGYRNFMAAMRTATGAEFESRFLGMRLHHHEGVRESQECQTRAVHRELQSLCATMVEEQEREIKQMSAWICEWFRDCVER